MSARLFRSILWAIVLLLISSSFVPRPPGPAEHDENEFHKWEDVKKHLRGILRAFRFSLENYIAVERTAPESLQSLLRSPYFPFMPSDIVNPYTGHFPEFISTMGEPSASYGPGTIVWLNGLRPQMVLMTVFEDRSQKPPVSFVLEEVLTPYDLNRLARIDNSPLLPGDTWKHYAALNFVDVRLYWECKYLYLVIQEIGFPEVGKGGRRFRKAVDAWFRNREWFPGPLRKPTDGKPLSYYVPDNESPPDPGSFSVYRVGDRLIPQCYGLLGRAISMGLEAMIGGVNSAKQSSEDHPEGASHRETKSRKGKEFRLP